MPFVPIYCTLGNFVHKEVFSLDWFSIRQGIAIKQLQPAKITTKERSDNY